MSKKRFTGDLENLLDTSTNQIELVEVVEKVEPQASATATAPPVAKKQKGFLSSLSSLFDESIADSVKAAPSHDGGGLTSLQGPKVTKIRIQGIDSLIRRTDTGTEVDFNFSATRRITVALDADALERLRKIAQSEKQYLKDLVNLAVAKYLEDRNK